MAGKTVEAVSPRGTHGSKKLRGWMIAQEAFPIAVKAGRVMRWRDHIFLRRLSSDLEAQYQRHLKQAAAHREKALAFGTSTTSARAAAAS